MFTTTNSRMGVPAPVCTSSAFIFNYNIIQIPSPACYKHEHRNTRLITGGMPSSTHKSPVLILLVAYSVAISSGSGSMVARDSRDTPCSGSVVTSANETLISVHARAGADLASWPLTCIFNGLESLDDCLFPAAGLPIEIPQCNLSDLSVDQDDWAMLTNATTLDELVADIDRVLQARINSGYPVERAQEVCVYRFKTAFCATRLTQLVEAIAWALPPSMGPLMYSTRSTQGSCGPSGLELPAELVSSNINSCCAAHDSCYNACGGFDRCGQQTCMSR